MRTAPALETWFKLALMNSSVVINCPLEWQDRFSTLYINSVAIYIAVLWEGQLLG